MEQFYEKDALSMLAEGQSISSYKRTRMATSFESNSQKLDRTQTTHKHKKHSPHFDKVTWDKEAVLQTLFSWSREEAINWSQVAKEHNIPGSNCGQILKEFAAENGIDIFELDKRQPNTRARAKKLRMPGGEISVPTHRLMIILLLSHFKKQ